MLGIVGIYIESVGREIKFPLHREASLGCTSVSTTALVKYAAC